MYISINFRFIIICQTSCWLILINGSSSIGLSCNKNRRTFIITNMNKTVVFQSLTNKLISLIGRLCLFKSFVQSLNCSTTFVNFHRINKPHNPKNELESKLWFSARVSPTSKSSVIWVKKKKNEIDFSFFGKSLLDSLDYSRTLKMLSSTGPTLIFWNSSSNSIFVWSR